MTPFEAVYGRLPPKLLTYIPGTTKMAAVDEVLKSREEILALLQYNLQHAQQKMKKYADLRRSERTLEVGQHVYLRLQPYRQGSMVMRRALKLSPQFYEAFTVIKKIGEVAYEFDLPASTRIHPVFHISQLKAKIGRSNVALPTLPHVDLNGIIQPEPEAVLDRRSKAQDNHTISELLIRWAGQSAEEATWEEFQALKEAYPHLVGKVV
jgi:hypothetical protein